METVYVVSGFMRSGTSMMMRSVQAGGIPAAYTPMRNWELAGRRSDGYTLNPHGVYELHAPIWQTPGQVKALAGSVVKILVRHLRVLGVCPDVEFRVVMMRRDPTEITQSAQKAFGNVPIPIERYHDALDNAVDALGQRDDVQSVQVADYENVMSDPLAVFEGMAANGWPINATKAAAVPDPEWWRFKASDL